jgi:hypothetical protein
MANDKLSLDIKLTAESLTIFVLLLSVRLRTIAAACAANRVSIEEVTYGINRLAGAVPLSSNSRRRRFVGLDDY